jgi:N-acetylgalactosamine kinase
MTADVSGLRPVNSWIDLIKGRNTTFHERLAEIYGGTLPTSGGRALKTEAAAMCLRTLEAFANRFGPDRGVMVIRSAGRVNLVGTHIDHRGGSVNPVCIKQMWLIVEPRDDDTVLAKNVESSEFADEQFRISDCLPAGQKISDWNAWCHDEFEKRKYDTSVTWSNYVRAAVLYLQHLHTKDNGTFAPAIKGMNMMLYGNIPRAAGISSSSAVVTAVAEATKRINALRIERADLIEHCGRAEQYVGTHGGCSDHAAIVLGRPNIILHITAFPLTAETISFPAGYSLVLANSLIEASKRTAARNTFNSRVAGYEFGLLMLRKNFPHYADKLEHLRDVNPQTLGIDEAKVYRMVKSLPTCATRTEILSLLPDCEQEVRRIFRTHDEPREGYRIRQICLYGIAECLRADMVPQLLRASDIKRFGELMTISHDGDRVTRLVAAKRVPTDNSYPDSRIDALISDLESGHANRVSRASLWRQSGGYNVSLPELDMLVDIALASSGVVGAGLVGAGMGGCIAAVVQEKHAQQLIENMAEQYYRPRNLPVGAEIITPVGGLYTIDV